MSRTVISRVTHESNISKVGSSALSLESQVIFPSPTSSATTVEPIGLAKNGRQFEHRVRIHRRLCIYIAQAKSFRIHDLVLKHDCDRETGYRVLLNLLLRQFLDFLNSVRHLLGGDMRLLRCGGAKRCRQD